MSDEKLAKLQALSDAATSPPWEAENSLWTGRPYNLQVPHTVNGVEVHPLVLGKWSDWAPSQEDMAVLVAARNALPELLAEVRRLRAIVAAAGGTP